MGQIKIPASSKLFIGLIYRDKAIKDKAIACLQKRLGRLDFCSQDIEFNYTDYYYPELGKPLKRVFVSFKRLLPENKLAGIKIHTNNLEAILSLDGKRRINIDPGFLSLGKVILATTKDHNHRIYLGKGIFAEATLFFQGKTYKPWPWTYPDYQSQIYLSAFHSIRRIYLQQIRQNAA